MQYRKFGALDWEASILGFGCMRFPTSDGGRLSPNILEDESIAMIRRAIDAGVNYFDTAYPYHSGMSEVVLGKALRDGYRERVKVATKLPVWMVARPEDFDALLDEQLRRLGTDHIDFYLLHALNRETWPNVVLRHNLLEKAAAAKADGRIRHLGFSFHDGYECFEQIVNATDAWEFCQIQFNYMDVDNQAGARGLKLAASKGLAVVVMEPLMGGRLTDPPKDVRMAMAACEARRTPTEWAFEWLWNQPEVSVVLSGMTTMEQLEENLSIADKAQPGGFGAVEEKLIASVQQMYRARTAIPCTKCGYCMPCPNGVKIPENFDFFNRAHLYDDLKAARYYYLAFLKPGEQSRMCIECGACEPLCPQKIQISEWMPKVTELLAAEGR